MLYGRRLDQSLSHVDGSRYALVHAVSKRARQINSYYGQLGDGLGHVVPPQVTSTARKPLSIAFEEIAADKIEGIEVDLEALAAEEAAAEAAAAADAEAAALDQD